MVKEKAKAGLIAILAEQTRKQERKPASLVVVRKVRKEQNTPLAVQRRLLVEAKVKGSLGVKNLPKREKRSEVDNGKLAEVPFKREN